MSYVHHPHTTPLEGKLLFQFLDEQVKRCPNKEAFVFRNESGGREVLTFKQYKEQSQALAAMLIEFGLARGDNVLVLLESSIEFVIVHMALNRIGAMVIIVEPHADEAVLGLREELTDLSCVFYCVKYSDVTSAVKEISDDAHFKAGIAVGATPPDGSRLHGYEHLLQKGRDSLSILAKAEAEVQFDDPSLILFTSGSSGIPKPVQYTHHGFLHGVLNENYAMNLTCDSIVFSDAPFEWITGVAILCIVPVIGMTYVAFPPQLALRGDVTGEILHVIEEERVTDAVLMTYFMWDMIRYEGLHRVDLSNLKRISTGGQNVEGTLLRKLLNLLPEVTVIVVYAATEFCSVANEVVTATNVDSSDLGCYDIVPGLEMKVVDSEERLVTRDTPGELYLRGAPLYLNVDSIEVMGVRYKTPKTATGWHQTSDCASITTDGKLKIHGRVDNLIKCATESIQPAEVETALSKHDNVELVIVVGVPDQRLYEVVCACVIFKSCSHGNQRAAIAQLDEWCSDKFFVSSIGLSSQPKHYVVLESFPNTRTGKTDRRALKAIAVEKLGL